MNAPVLPSHSVARCFSVWVLPHLLYVDDFADRRKTVVMGTLAWNIALFPTIPERERQIDGVVQMIGRLTTAVAYRMRIRGMM